MLEDVIQVGLVMMAAYGFQSAIGFAGGLLSIPLLVSLGYTLPMAIEMNLVAALIQSAMSSYKLRKDVPWQVVKLPALLRFFALFAGMAVLFSIQDLDKAIIKRWVGIAVLSLTLLQLLVRPTPRENVALAWTILAGLTSGFCLGLVGMGGPPLVLWAMAHNWSSEKTRGALFAAYIPGTIGGAVVGPIIFGEQVLYSACVTLIATPIILAGVPIGMWVGKKIPKPKLQAMAYVTLVLVSFKAILAA
jgi:uncharacterized membrane protein YfcA